MGLFKKVKKHRQGVPSVRITTRPKCDYCKTDKNVYPRPGYSGNYWCGECSNLKELSYIIPLQKPSAKDKELLNGIDKAFWYAKTDKISAEDFVKVRDKFIEILEKMEQDKKDKEERREKVRIEGFKKRWLK